MKEIKNIARNTLLSDLKSNPLVHPPKLKYNAVPFDLIKTEHFEPAVKFALCEAENEIAMIESNLEPATFENTILAMECSGSLMNRIMLIYRILHGHESDNDFKDLATKLYPPLTEFGHRIITSKPLFKRVEHVHKKRMDLGLTGEQIRLVEENYNDFIKNGINLNQKDQDDLKAINIELSKVSNKFAQNVLNSRNTFEYTITDAKELDGVPETAMKLMAQTATDKGHDGGWTILLQMPFTHPVMTYAKNRKLREFIFKSLGSVAYNDEFDNQENILNKVDLLYRFSRLLGFDTYADYVLQDRMAESLTTVKGFLDSFYKISKTQAINDLAEVKLLAQKMDGLKDPQPWDMGYYTEKLKQKKYGFNTEELRPYFKMDNVITGVFKIAEKLYGLQFEEKFDIQTFHPSVKTYSVSDAKYGHLGILMLDLFPRTTKRNGAWMATLQPQGLIDGSSRRPIACMGANLMPGTNDQPSLLSLQEVKTIFHEFGHALHHILSQCTYTSLSGTRVLWDFVELPSQIMENWVYEKEALDLFAVHYETGESIPDDLLKKVQDAKNFMAGRSSLGQLNGEYLDLAWYTTNPKNITDVTDFEDKIDAKTRLMPKVNGTNSSCSFSHIFAGGYAVGYYSYRWAESLDADAYELLKEKGIFNKETASSFRENILSKGNTIHPKKLYKKFRGRQPDPKALMRRNGLT
mgnify:FL=1|jgi:Zn-dependent oligopeptidase